MDSAFCYGDTAFPVDLGPVSHIFYSALLTPLLLIPLARLNRPLLAWRKKRGRDIEEEEKHEIAGSDIISLMAKVLR